MSSQTSNESLSTSQKMNKLKQALSASPIENSLENHSSPGGSEGQLNEKKTSDSRLSTTEHKLPDTLSFDDEDDPTLNTMTLFRKASSLHLGPKPELLSQKKKKTYSIENCSFNWRKQLKTLDEEKFDMNSINQHIPDWKKAVMRKRSIMDV
eukprot:gene6842-11003_t